MTIQEIEEREIIASYCLNSFEFFVRYFFAKRFGNKFIMNEHHLEIIQTLDKVVKGELTRVIFNVAPRYGKTEIIVKNFISWCMALNPSSKFIHLSYSDQLALDNSEEVKDLITSDEFTSLFQNVHIKKDSRAKNKWYTTENGGILARSSSGQVTGFGAGKVDNEDEEEKEFLSDLDRAREFAGAIIIDDPIKPSDASSDTIRDKINNKFESTIRSRVNSRKTPIIIVMQRLHEDDLCGYLQTLEPEEWTVISMPVIKENGMPLWEHKHTLKELNKIKKANEFVFQTQYMQNPMPEVGLLFPKGQLNKFDFNTFDIKQVEFVSAFIDTADTGEDFQSVPIAYNIGSRIYIYDVLFTQKGTDENIQMTADILNKYKPTWTRVESNMGGSMYTQLLRQKYKGQLLPIRAKTNKQSRIKTLSGFIKEHCYFRHFYEEQSDYGKFMKQLTRYLISGENKHDDAADSLHGLCNMIRKFYPHLYRDFEIIGDGED